MAAPWGMQNPLRVLDAARSVVEEVDQLLDSEKQPLLRKGDRRAPPGELQREADRGLCLLAPSQPHCRDRAHAGQTHRPRRSLRLAAPSRWKTSAYIASRPRRDAVQDDARYDAINAAALAG